MNKITQKNSASVSPQVIEPLYSRASAIIEGARSEAYRQVNYTLIRRNWDLGKMIAEEELNGEDRAKYGAAVIKELSKRLTASYGKGFTKTNLYGYVKFYEMFPQIFHSLSGKSSELLSWTHYRILIQELNDDARRWYETEAASQNWSVRTLQRNISSQYYIRHQDVGQMDMYVRMYDQLKRTEGDNPTIGILLCDDTDEDIARFSVLHDNDQLFASKYMTYMPSPEQLRAEIERQKMIFQLKHQLGDDE